jgi:N4-gp56 family major capsid protein
MATEMIKVEPVFSKDMELYLVIKMLENIAEKSTFEKYATLKIEMPKNVGNEVKVEKWVTVMDLMYTDNANATVIGNVIDVANQKSAQTYQMVQKGSYNSLILPEGGHNDGKAKQKLIHLKAKTFRIGDWAKYSEEMEDHYHRPYLKKMAEGMSDHAAKEIDTFYRDTFSNGAGHVKDLSAAGKTIVDPEFRRTLVNMTTAIKLSGGDKVNRILSSSPNYDTVPVQARYTAIIPTVMSDVISDVDNVVKGFIPVEKYAAGTKVQDSEVGILGGVRLLEDPNAYYEILPDGSYKVEVLVFGKDHTAQIPLRGKNRVEFIHKSINSGGTENPLNRSGSLGWKAVLGAKVVYPERLGKITVNCPAY